MPHTRPVKLVFPTSQVGECGSLRTRSKEEFLETRWNPTNPFPLEDVEDNFLQSTNTHSSCMHFLSPALATTGRAWTAVGTPTVHISVNLVSSSVWKESRTDLRIPRA